MAASLVGGAAVGAVFGELLKVVLEIRGKAIIFKQTLASLRSTLVAITPTFKEIEQHNNDLGRPKEELEWLIKEIEKGTELVRKCSKINRLNYVARVRYQDQLEEFIDSLVRFFTINMQAYTSRDQKETLLELRKIRSLINKLPLVNPEDTAGSSSYSITVSESDIYDSETTQPADENAVETNCTEEAMENISPLTRNSSWDSDSIYFSAYEDESDIPLSPTQTAENAAGANSAGQALVPLTSIAHETYDHSCIEKGMQSEYMTCLKTQQTLTSTVIIPNYVLRSLGEQWCEANGIEPPIRASSSQPSKSASAYSPAERSKIGNLLQKLKSVCLEDQRLAAGEIRLLAHSADNRVAIAEAGAIPLLVSLLSVLDSRTQEHAVTALLNLSIYDNNKGSIVLSGAIPSIVHLLKKGSMKARENAAATLQSLSVMVENRVLIGSSGAIPPLVTLLSEGTQRGKKDAAKALFNLCIYRPNNRKAVSAGVIPTLMRLLTEPSRGMVDEALRILTKVSFHPEGNFVIGAEEEAVPILVEFICNGSQRNKENAAAVLVNLCSGDQQYIVQALELGVMGPLSELAQNGTGRGKRKAAHLIELMDMFL